MTTRTRLWVAGVLFATATTLLILEYLTDIQWLSVVSGLLSFVGAG